MIVNPFRGCQMIPGAVPRGFGSTIAPLGRNACLRLLEVISRPRLGKFFGDISQHIWIFDHRHIEEFRQGFGG